MSVLFIRYQIILSDGLGPSLFLLLFFGKWIREILLRFKLLLLGI